MESQRHVSFRNPAKVHRVSAVKFHLSLVLSEYDSGATWPRDGIHSELEAIDVVIARSLAGHLVMDVPRWSRMGSNDNWTS